MNRRAVDVSSAEKSVTVQTHKNKQTVNDISTPCLSACVDSNYPVAEKQTHKQTAVKTVGVGNKELSNHLLVRK